MACRLFVAAHMQPSQAVDRAEAQAVGANLKSSCLPAGVQLF
jgi:hypothetical protein